MSKDGEFLTCYFTISILGAPVAQQPAWLPDRPVVMASFSDGGIFETWTRAVR